MKFIDVNDFCYDMRMHEVTKKVIDKKKREFLLWQQQHENDRTDRNSCLPYLP
jgi:hypothetical protein